MSTATLILLDDAGLLVTGFSPEGLLRLDPTRPTVIGNASHCDVQVKGPIGGRTNLYLDWSAEEEAWKLVHSGHSRVIRLNDVEEITSESAPHVLQDGDVFQPVGACPGPRFRFELREGEA